MQRTEARLAALEAELHGQRALLASLQREHAQALDAQLAACNAVAATAGAGSKPGSPPAKAAGTSTSARRGGGSSSGGGSPTATASGHTRLKLAGLENASPRRSSKDLALTPKSDSGISYPPLAGKVYPPTDLKARAVTPRKCPYTLQLTHVFGYRGRDCRNNVRYVGPQNDVAFFTSSLGVVYNKETNEQRFFTDHTDNIVCLAVHPNKKYVATGQVGPEPSICVWDGSTSPPRSLAFLNGKLAGHAGGIIALCFTSKTADDDGLLVSIGAEPAHTLAVWDWRKVSISAKAEIGPNKIYVVETNRESGTIITAGLCHLTFWTVNGNAISGEEGDFGKNADASSQAMMCCGFAGPTSTLVGTSEGELTVWERNVLAIRIKAHNGPVYALCVSPDFVITGGGDGSIHFWKFADDKRSLAIAKTVNASAISSTPSIRSLSVNENGGILFGTGTNEIAESEGASIKILLRSHFGEVAGLAMHPSKLKMITVGHDQTLRIWSLQTRRMLGVLHLDEALSVVAYSPCGNFAAVGLLNGGLMVLEVNSLKVVTAKKDRVSSITDTKYSPDGLLLAVTSRDATLDIYDVAENYALKATCSGHASPVTHVDWSKDGAYLQSCGEANDMLYWTSSGKQLKGAHQVRDVEWDTMTCPFGWSISGVWEGAHCPIQAMDRAHGKRALAVALEDGTVCLHSYPFVRGNVRGWSRLCPVQRIGNV
eukprot:TRINITY_DN1599_c0_g1_i4.p1 TRINITY_DN1599_c0_g1~~TRINITY_DN1599_c0_g1_i4.p1  ORF type:complete len:776 (-),score=155.27 TRINITY_DN1599_c0_g1_i4:492-2624(-)